MIGLFKAFWAGGAIAWHILFTLVGRIFISDPVKLRRFYVNSVARHTRWIAKALDVTLVVEGSENARPGQNYFIVGNHLSYLDGVLIPTFLPTTFVTSIEMRQVPVLGLITELGGCLYVERRSKDNIHSEISGIAEALRQGFNVVIFPEATSTNGEQVRPFKRPLFAAAAQALVPVLPLVIQYESIDGEPVTRNNRDYLCWYGDMGFGGHFLKLAMRKNIRIRIKVLPEIPVTAASTRDTLMEEAYQRVLAQYRPIE
jgi:1-acyl-sn-glycerol-3-phosphate acyltransferase